MNACPLLFDLDGTLTDPSAGFLSSLRYAMEQLGVPDRADQDLFRFIGPPLRDTMGEILGTEDANLIEEGVRLYRWRLENGGMFEATPYEGIAAVLGQLVSRGHPLFVCTSKPEFFAIPILHHFSLHDFFVNVYGAQPDGRLADKADLVRHLLTEEGYSSGPGIMVGDTRFDMMAARKNELGAIGVTWGFGPSDDLLAHGAHRLVSEMGGLIEAIEELSRNAGN